MKRGISVAAGLGMAALCGSTLFSADVEVGTVKWGRDYEKALRVSAESGKPVLILFQEVPGCSGCQKFGREVLSHPQIVEAIESEFEPVLVYNNRPGKDAESLAAFKEPAWNYQVIRFLDSKGKDIIARRDQIWTVESVARRMVQALETARSEVPIYLRALAGVSAAKEPATAAFAMFCFWTGEQKLGGISGVLTTEAGWLEGHEVTLVTYDRSVLPFADLLGQAASFDCARKIYANDPAEQQMVVVSRLAPGTLTKEYQPARDSDQKRQISGSLYSRLNLSPIQATKLNAYARTDPAAAHAWLSPRQLALLKQSRIQP